MILEKWKRIRSSGQGMLEVVLALAIFGFLAAALISMVAGGFRGLEQGGEQTQAEALVQEGIEAVRAIRDRAWNENIYSLSAVSISGSEWVFDGESTTQTIGQFTRTISFDDVCRDAIDEIATCPGAYTDVHSKKVTSTVDWTIRGGISNTVQRVAYITNWDSQEWVEDTTTDFSDGTFNFTEVSSSQGDGDGAVILQQQ